MSKIKNAAIFFFSGTGNTYYAGKRLSKDLNEKTIPTKAYSIESISIKEANDIIEKSQIVIFGYPIYASYLPQPMVDFMNGLNNVNSKECGIFCTQMIFSGDGAKIGDSLINSKGFITKWAYHFNMPNNLNSGTFDFLPITNDKTKLEKARNKTNKECEKFASFIAQDKTYLKGFGKISTLIARYQRFSDNPKSNMWNKAISIDLNKCVSCGLCKKLCPIGNIISTNKVYSAKTQCAGCVRCHNFCPNNAIIFQNKPNDRVHYHGLEEGFNPLVLRGYKE